MNANGNANGIATELQHALRTLTIATVVLYLVLGSFIAIGWIDSTSRRAEIARVAERTNDALCVLRGDLEARVESAEQTLLELLRTNTTGFPVATTRASIRSQRDTVEALEVLACPRQRG